MKDKASKLTNIRYSRSLLAIRVCGLAVAMATIKAGLALLAGNNLHGGNIWL